MQIIMSDSYGHETVYVPSNDGVTYADLKAIGYEIVRYVFPVKRDARAAQRDMMAALSIPSGSY